MKKLYLLLLMFSIFALPNMTTQAYTVNDNDIAISQLNGLTLNQVFRDANLIPNGDFSLGTTGWSAFRGIGTVSNNVYTLTGNTTGTFMAIFRDITVNTVDDYYIYAYLMTPDIISNIRIAGDIITLSIQTNPLQNQYYFLSTKTKMTSTRGRHQLQLDFSNVDTKILNIKQTNRINLTSLGIASLNKVELDFWFNQWTINNAYIQGELDGYATGLQDNTAYVQGYNVGYTDGLVEGTDMETGSSILIFVVAAIGFIMMIFGFTTRRGIFNLLSVGAFVVLGAMLAQYIGFIIIAIGLVIINVYYAFWGDL